MKPYLALLAFSSALIFGIFGCNKPNANPAPQVKGESEEEAAARIAAEKKATDDKKVADEKAAKEKEAADQLAARDRWFEERFSGKPKDREETKPPLAETLSEFRGTNNQFEMLRPRYRALSFSPNGQMLASVTAQGQLTFWDVSITNTFRLELADLDPWVHSVAIAPDGKSILIGGSEGLKLYHVSGRLLHQFADTGKNIFAVAFSPDGSLIADGSDKKLRLWEFKSRKLLHTLDGFKGMVNSIDFSPDGKLVAMSAERERDIRVWETESGKSKHVLANKDGFGDSDSVRFSPNGKYIAAAIGFTSKIWEADSGKEAVVFPTIDLAWRITAVAFSADSRYLADGSENGIVRVWDIEAKEARVVSNAPRNDIDVGLNRGHVLRFTNDGKTLASATWDKTIKLINLLVVLAEKPGLKIQKQSESPPKEPGTKSKD